MMQDFIAKLKDKWFWIFFGILIVTFITGFYCVCDVTMLVGTEEQFSQLPNVFYFLSFGVFLIAFAAFIFFAIKNKQYKPNKFILAILGLVFLTNILAALLFPNGVTYNHYIKDVGYKADLVFSIEGIDRVKSIINFFIVLSASLIILDILPVVLDRKTFLTLAGVVTVAIVTVFIVVTYFAEFESYKYVIQNLKADDIKLHAVHSLFPNGNSFGFIIFLGVIASVVLNIQTKKWWWLLFPIYFIISLVFTFAKLPVFASGLLLVGYLITKLVLTWKENRKRNGIITLCVSGVIILACGATLVVELTTHKVSELFNSIFNYSTYNTLDSRKAIWQNVADILKVSNWRVGLGFGIFNDLLYKFNMAWEPVIEHNINQTEFAHNGILELIGNGGFVLLVVYCILLGIVIYKSVKIFKTNKEIAVFEYILMSIALVYMMFESGRFILPTNLDYSILSVFITFPILSIYRENKVVNNI